MFPRHWLQLAVAVGVAVSISACAGNSTGPNALAEPAFQDDEDTAAQVKPLVPLIIDNVDVTAMAERLRNHPYGHYSIADNAYSYYAGGVLYAEYKVAKRTLFLRPDPADGRECVLDLTDGGKDKVSDACRRLVNIFKDELGEAAVVGG